MDFYFPARVDPAVPIEETIGAAGDLIREGKVLYAGLSAEASAGTIRRGTCAVHPISAVEIEYSLWSRDIEDDVLPAVRELGIGILAYSTLFARPADRRDYRLRIARGRVISVPISLDFRATIWRRISS